MRQDFTFENQHFNTDDAISGFRFGKSIIDIGTKGVQRHATFAIPLRAAHLGATESSGTIDLDTLGTKFKSLAHAFFHGAAKGYAALKLKRNVFGNKLGIDLRFADFLNVDKDFLVGQLAQLFFQSFDLGAFFTDDNPRTRGKNIDFCLICSTLNFNL